MAPKYKARIMCHTKQLVFVHTQCSEQDMDGQRLPNLGAVTHPCGRG
jgi:hypothetical protein